MEERLIPVIYKLSHTTSKTFSGKIPAYSEEIVKNLAEKQMVHPAVAKEAREIMERHQEENKKRAQATRTQALEEMKRKRAAAASKNAIEMVPVREYLTCVSCKAGYEERNSLMGVYSFWIKQEIPQQDTWWTESKRSTSITSLTSFTAIHYECHREAQAYNSQ